MYTPETFVCYQALARAVLRTYEVDRNREYRKCLKAKNDLLLRLKDGKSKGLVRRWSGRPEDAWKSWNHSFEKYEEVLQEENSEMYKLLVELALCEPVAHCQSGSNLQISKRSY